MSNLLGLLAGNDIPFQQAQLIIHQPKIKEIAYIGEDNFYAGCQLLTFSKDKLDNQDKIHLEQLSDFKILMTIIKNKDTVIMKRKAEVEMVLSLLFPQYQINFLPESIMLFKRDNETNQIESHLIDQHNFQMFRKHLKIIFCLQDDTSGIGRKYNPGGPQSRALVQKFKMRQKKLAELRNKDKKDQSISILSRYISILAVGLGKDMNQLLQYTVYQLFDEFRRLRMKDDFDRFISFRLAGAKDIEQKEYWMENIHSDTL